jgi:hypothetical protein
VLQFALFERFDHFAIEPFVLPGNIRGRKSFNISRAGADQTFPEILVVNDL